MVPKDRDEDRQEEIRSSSFTAVASNGEAEKNAPNGESTNPDLCKAELTHRVFPDTEKFEAAVTNLYDQIRTKKCTGVKVHARHKDYLIFSQTDATSVPHLT